MSKRRSNARPAPPPPPDGREAAAEAVLRAPLGREWWQLGAWLVLALFVALAVYLGARPGGRGPIWAYLQGRMLLALAALGLLAVGVVRSTVKRPFFQPGRLRALVALALVVGLANYPFPFPSVHEGHPSRVAFRLPVEGEWTVFWGGDDKDANRLAAFLPDRRWGLHLVVAEDGRTHAGEGERAEDYLCFDRALLAPAGGTVVTAHDGEPDRAPRAGAREGEPFGNHLVLEVAEGEYLFLCHLRAGSLLVGEGDAVVAGQPLARVGSSGFSAITPEPHAALHLQDDPRPRAGQAIPWRFHDYLADGRPVAAGLPRGGIGPGGELLGQRVRASAPPGAGGGGEASAPSADEPRD